MAARFRKPQVSAGTGLPKAGTAGAEDETGGSIGFLPRLNSSRPGSALLPPAPARPHGCRPDQRAERCAVGAVKGDREIRRNGVDDCRFEADAGGVDRRNREQDVLSRPLPGLVEEQLGCVVLDRQFRRQPVAVRCQDGVAAARMGRVAANAQAHVTPPQPVTI